MKETKQIIVIRKDLRMRRGKEIAQGAHASMAVFTKELEVENIGVPKTGYNGKIFQFEYSEVADKWFKTSFAKICVTVNSEQELLDVYNKAKEAGLLCSLITDNGKTEFNGVPTITCCAIGPGYAEDIDPITKHLPLY